MREKSTFLKKCHGLQRHTSRNARLVFPSVALPKGVKHHVTECRLFHVNCFCRWCQWSTGSSDVVNRVNVRRFLRRKVGNQRETEESTMARLEKLLQIWLLLPISCKLRHSCARKCLSFVGIIGLSARKNATRLRAWRRMSYASESGVTSYSCFKTLVTHQFSLSFLRFAHDMWQKLMFLRILFAFLPDNGSWTL